MQPVERRTAVLICRTGALTHVSVSLPAPAAIIDLAESFAEPVAARAGRARASRFRFALAHRGMVFYDEEPVWSLQRIVLECDRCQVASARLFVLANETRGTGEPEPRLCTDCYRALSAPDRAVALSPYHG